MAGGKSKSGNFQRVALVLPTEFAYARGVLRGIIQATRERNFYVSSADNDGATLPWLFRIYRGIYGHSSKYLARWFQDWRPDGVICQIYDDRLAKVYRATRKPIVELFESRLNSEFPRVLPDDVATGELAARHFIDRGFRHFAYFGAPWMIWARERQAGFERAIRHEFAARRTQGRDDHFTFHHFGSEDNERLLRGPDHRRAAAMGRWLKSLPRPCATFVANDLWGVELVQAARESGLRVPEDVALLGVDNEELLCEMAHPPLSSIRLGTEQIGHTAVSLLDQLLQKRKVDLIARLPPMEVITRQSTDVLAVEDADVAAALRHIRQHATDGLSVKELLEVVAVNRRTLERRFVSLLGHTPLQEIHRIRLDRVKALLQTDLPIYEIAHRCGFSKPEHMATSFLKATGQSPTEFRKQVMPASRWQRLLPSSA